MYRNLITAVLILGCISLTSSALGQAAPRSRPTDAGIPADARYACPMETHPAETDPARQGAYFSAEPGDCPWCGMHLKPLADLSWVQARLAAQGAEVAYTCPDHQHVFSSTPGDCPRCGKPLQPFKVMYTCPDPRHADVISVHPGTCPRCGQKLTPYRGVWLAPEMADRNVPPHPQAASQAPYHCPVHPLAHSDKPGKCPICGGEMTAAAPAPPAVATKAIPADAKYVCPMESCWQFSTEPGACPECGMKLLPIEQVDWAQAIRTAGGTATAAAFVCPMHPEQTSATHGTCPICGMQLVSADALPRPASVPAAIETQVNFLMEHYLELQRRFASDSVKEVPLHALGLVGAADELLRLADDPAAKPPAGFFDAVRTLRAAALKLAGKDLDADRVTFVELSGAMRRIVEGVRPDTKQFPKLFIFHCPMTKGDWIQTTEEMANPFYGYKMLKCGEPVETK